MYHNDTHRGREHYLGVPCGEVTRILCTHIFKCNRLHLAEQKREHTQISVPELKPVLLRLLKRLNETEGFDVTMPADPYLLNLVREAFIDPNSDWDLEIHKHIYEIAVHHAQAPVLKRYCHTAPEAINGNRGYAWQQWLTQHGITKGELS